MAVNTSAELHGKHSHNKKFYIYILTILFSDKMSVKDEYLAAFCLFCAENIVFLILLNVKIPSPLERFKMRHVGLFSQNGASVRIS